MYWHTSVGICYFFNQTKVQKNFFHLGVDSIIPQLYSWAQRYHFCQRKRWPEFESHQISKDKKAETGHHNLNFFGRNESSCSPCCWSARWPRWPTATGWWGWRGRSCRPESAEAWNRWLDFFGATKRVLNLKMGFTVVLTACRRHVT